MESLLKNPFMLEYFHSTLIELERIFTSMLIIFIETFYILQKWKPIYHILFLCCFLVYFALKSFLLKPSPIYLVDFACLKPPPYCRAPSSSFLEHASLIEVFDKEAVEFMAKILKSAGLSEGTYLPPPLHYIPPETNQKQSIEEVHMVLFPVFEDLLSKTKLSPEDVDILIVNCSGFCPSPSLSSIVMNKYNMRSDIKSYNLSGMGCSAGAIAIDLAQKLLRVHKNSYAVVLSTEILSNGWYKGREKSKLLINCLFRMGTAAVLLTNKKEAKTSSKYKLFCALRTQMAFDDKAYLSAIREEDSNGNLGVTISKDLPQVAREILRTHISFLGSPIFPFTEKFKHGVSMIRKKCFDKSSKIYMPNFKAKIQHFCLPSSGRTIIKEIGKGIKLGERDMEAALMTLHRFGNQSSSSLWYQLAYLEAKERVEKGDKVWQLWSGTGPKCNSVVWECLKTIVGESKVGPWADSVHR